MVLRLLATILFGTLLGIPTTAHSEDFAHRFIEAAANTPPVFVIEDGGGQVQNLRHYRGHYVLLNLWATWCEPCVKEMPSLDALAGRAKTEFPALIIIPLTEDRNAETAAQGFYLRHDLHHLGLFLDRSGDATAILHAKSMPTTILFDPDGQEVGRVGGEVDWTAPDVLSFLHSRIKK